MRIELQQEQAVQERKLYRRERDRTEVERKYEMNRRKKKEKRRGR